MYLPHLKKALGGLGVTLALAPLAAAQTPPIRDPNDQFMREQQERLRRELIERSAQGAIQQEDAPQASAASGEGFPAGLATTGPSFEIHDIGLDGDAGLLAAARFRLIAHPFLGQKLAVEHINVLLERINKALIEAGYTTSRAYVGGQNLQGGVLTVTIVAGRIEKILLDGQPASGIGARLAMPMKAGDILRLQDIEQAVDQLNRLRRNSMQVLIKPGEGHGGSIVEFANKRGDALHYNIGVDNGGSTATGTARVQMGLDAGDVLGLMESINIGLTTSQETNAIHALLSVPFGYYTVSAMASVSEYQNLIADTALVYGRSRNYSLSLNRLLSRDQTSKTALDISLARRDSTREVNNYPLLPQAQTSVRAGLNRLQRFDTASGPAQFTIDAGISKGIRALGADRDPADLPKEAARYQFSKLDLTATLDRPLPRSWMYRSRLNAQWSRHPLYSSEQLFAGGMSSVRAYPESYLGGDRGWVWRNEFSYPRAQPLWDNSVRYEPYLFVDAARLNTVSDRRSRTLAGAGAGARVVFQRLFGDVQLGRAFHSPQGWPRQGWRLNANVTYQF
ncbi:ShlB/FhaC/HecB family hemolysin secretion/activation protein [Diaphorobacter ruginosibacter]|uniref:ShlB/FhaC/HecB family hemolysin secretion/activation protein n=1 Tax=Diaphorobacter ruginosibacter TaxID=1715720 RepID=UPI0033421BAC